MPKKISSRQERILEFIQKFLDEHGLPPTIRDIQKACAISSTSVVDYNLRILQREGYITRRPDIARGIELSNDKADTTLISRIPLTGYISAGAPLPAMTSESWSNPSPLETFEVPPNLIKRGRNLYALKVQGTSMIDAFIDDGDIVIIEPVNQAENGDMVVASLKLEKEVTLKRIYQNGSQVRLQPANHLMKPIFVNADNIEVHGRVVSVLRVLT